MRISKPIQGGRIRIRNYEATDLAFVTGMWFDEENGKYLSDPTQDYVDEAFQRALDGLSDSKLGFTSSPLCCDSAPAEKKEG